MSDERIYHMFEKKTMKLRDVLGLLRSSDYSNYDECGIYVVLCPTCEEWTHVRINLHSCFLDLLDELMVMSICADEDDIQLWIKTDDYNWFNTGEKTGEECPTQD